MISGPTVVAVVAGAVAVVLWLRPSARAALLRHPRGAPGRRRVWIVLAALGIVASIVASRILLGGEGATVAVVLVAVAGTVAVVGREGALRRSTARTRHEVAHGCQVLARLVSAGQVPGDALRIAAADAPVLARAASMLVVGGDPVEVWRAQAREPGHEGLLPLARAWQVSRATGSPMSRPVRDVAEALLADRSMARVVTAELSAPRATGRLLAVLPAFGIALGFLLGGDPLAFLLHNWVGQLCLVSGALLACAGVLWVERLARRGARW